MDGIRPGGCMVWKPAAGGASATVTVVAVDLEGGRALVHVTKASTGTCAPHWVSLSALSGAVQGARPCACVSAVPPAHGHDAA
jgi:hypothetical protein